MSKIKLYCVFAKESIDKMKGIRGKLASMAGHGFVHSVWDAEKRFPEMVQAYKDSGVAYKITLVVPTVDDLSVLYESYHEKCGVSLVTDAGLTVFDGPTTVCLGIGPISENLVESDLSGIKTLT